METKTQIDNFSQPQPVARWWEIIFISSLIPYFMGVFLVLLFTLGIAVTQFPIQESLVSFDVNSNVILPVFRFLIVHTVELLIVAFFLKRYKLSWKDIGLTVSKTKWKQYLIWTVLCSPLLILLITLSLIVGEPLYSPDVTKYPLSSLSEIILVIAVFPAIAEEIIYRGLVFKLLRSRMSRFWAWITQAGLFGISHIFVGTPVHATILGLILGLGPIKTGSLLPGMIAHFLNNAFVTLTKIEEAQIIITSLF